MIRIGITGADGFLGWHLRIFLRPAQNISLVMADRETFADPKKLREFAGSVDAIAHLAGANRGDDRLVRDTNVALAKQLVAACESAGARPHIVFANSTHHTRTTMYGEAKRMAAKTLAAWAAKAQAPFTNLVIPHIFGEGGRPHYNSAVATFCHQIANGEKPRIIKDGELELIHAQRVAEEISAAINRRQGGETRLRGTSIRVSAVLSVLQSMAQQYAAHVIPEFPSLLALDLFNNYRWYLFPQRYPIDLKLRFDQCGTMFDAVKTLHGGQCMLSITGPAITRGDHYHRRKLERVLVMQGEGLIRIRRLLDDNITEFRVSGARPQFVDMPTLHTHSITNTGAGNLTTLFWTQEISDDRNPDTYSEKI